MSRRNTLNLAHRAMLWQAREVARIAAVQAIHG